MVVTYGNSAAMAAKQATALIPIVFAAAGDPVGSGLVASLARPGGNVTGLSIQQTDLAGKRLEILREVVPTLRTLAIMAKSSNPAPGGDARGSERRGARTWRSGRQIGNPAGGEYRARLRGIQGRRGRPFTSSSIRS